MGDSQAVEPIRAGGLSWDRRPYVRVGEREAWNTAFNETAAELKMLRKYPEAPTLSDHHIFTVAWNVAYRLIWAQR